MKEETIEELHEQIIELTATIDNVDVLISIIAYIRGMKRAS